jgi:serine/threonine protein kinase
MGNLYTFLSKQPQRTLIIDDAVLLFGQILQGLEQIHAKNIIHRDIKLENIFLKRSNKGAGYSCKIGDFGLARPINNDETAVTNCGTEIYMAPEILSGQSYGRQADIWSMGVLFYCMLFGDFPFKGINILDEIKVRCKNGFKLNEGSRVRGLRLNQ